MFRCLSILWFLSFEVLTGLWVNVAEHSLFGIGAFVPFLRGGVRGSPLCSKMHVFSAGGKGHF